MNNPVTITIRQVTPEDTSAVAVLLDAARLPPLDESVETVFSIVALHEGTIVGHAAIEVHDQYGLLRSVATYPGMQRSGIATRLVKEVEKIACDQGLATVYLLTETAEQYFSNRSYVVLDRTDAPDSIRRSSEFSSVCPDSAVLMYKHVMQESNG